MTPGPSVTVCDISERVKTARVEFNCPLKVAHGFFPASLTPLNVTGHREYPGIIWQAQACNFQFSESAIVVQVSIIKVRCSCEVCLPAIWTDAKCFLDGCFRCRQPRRSMVKPKEVKLVMNHRELAIGLEKRWVARHRLVQQIDCVQRILPPPGNSPNIAGAR